MKRRSSATWPWLAALVLVATLGLAACGGDGENGTSSSGTGSTAGDTRARDIGLVSAYCLYSSDTQGQMFACEKRTKPAQVRAADDEAARWARDELQACGKSAGELCQYYRGGSEGQSGD